MKTTYLALGVVALATLLGYTLYQQSHSEDAMCPLDVMVCPDGSTVPRSGPSCEFGVCKNTNAQKDVAENNKKETPSSVTSQTETNISPIENTKNNVPSSPKETTTPRPGFIGSLTTAIQTIVGEGKTFVSSVSTGIKETTSQSSSNENNQTQSNQSKTSLNETRYEVRDGAIIDSNNHIISIIPPSVSYGSGTSSSIPEGWETHTVNAVKVNETAPVIDGVPVEGLPGKYYVSENSFGNIENCEFSNRIYIYDVTTKEKILLYEENSNTLSKEDPRACNSEMYLLATDKEKLIMKYHTINTNMVCESTWSEPEKTWYLDVTKLANQTRRYVISNDEYEKAEQAESLCRLNLTQDETE